MFQQTTKYLCFSMSAGEQDQSMTGTFKSKVSQQRKYFEQLK
jgi:hypothetical protein